MAADLQAAEQLYERLQSKYQNPYTDKTSDDNKKRLADNVGYYHKGYTDAEKVTAVLEKFAAEKEYAIFCLLLALEQGFEASLIEKNFGYLVLTMGRFKPKLWELIKGEFWKQPFGVFKIRPYKENQT